jgi:hypothetical protein
MTNHAQASELLSYYRLKWVELPRNSEIQVRLLGVAAESLWDKTDQVFLRPTDVEWDRSSMLLFSLLIELVDDKSTKVLILLDLSAQDKPPCRIVFPDVASSGMFPSITSAMSRTRTGLIAERGPLLDWSTLENQERWVRKATRSETLSTRDGPLLVKARLIAQPRGPYSLKVEARMNAGVRFEG